MEFDISDGRLEGTPEYIQKSAAKAQEFLQKAGYSEININDGWKLSHKFDTKTGVFVPLRLRTDNPDNFSDKDCLVLGKQVEGLRISINIVDKGEGQEPDLLIRFMNLAAKDGNPESNAIEWVQITGMGTTEEKTVVSYRMRSKTEGSDRRGGLVVMKTGDPVAHPGLDIDELMKYDEVGDRDAVFDSVERMQQMRRSLAVTIEESSQKLDQKIVMASLLKNKPGSVEGFAINAIGLMKRYGVTV